MRIKSLYSFLAVALTVSMVLGLSACGKTGTTSVAEPEDVVVSTESSQAEENLAESAAEDGASSESEVTKEQADDTEDVASETINSEESAETESSESTNHEESSEDADTDYRDYEEPFGEEISIDAATQKKMNIFLSNFSEAGLRSFDKDDYDLRDLFAWAFIWTKINKWDNITFENRPEEGAYSVCEVISLENVNKIFNKYLGFEVSDEEATAKVAERDDYYWLFYEDGAIKAPAADGESYTGLSIVNKAEDLGNNKLKLYFTHYSQDLDAYFDGTEKDVYYVLTGDEAANNPELEQEDFGYAIVRVEDGSYKLEHLEIK